jgi:membrane protein implicated in regulation of membrane protease activity
LLGASLDNAMSANQKHFLTHSRHCVLIRTLLLTPVGTFVLAVLLGALLWAVLPAGMGRPLGLWEAFVVTAAIVVLLEWLRRRRLWRKREEIESLRDSALW